MAPDEACEHDMLVLVRWQVEGWPSPSLNSTLSIQTNQPLKPSVTGTIGSRRATFSEVLYGKAATSIKTFMDRC